MYEFHTTQEGTSTKPGDTFNVDYSVMQTLRLSAGAWRLHVGLVGYEQRQTTAKKGPSISPEQSRERYTVHAVGVGFFKEFASRSTFEGFSLQVSGAIGF